METATIVTLNLAIVLSLGAALVYFNAVRAYNHTLQNTATERCCDTTGWKRSYIFYGKIYCTIVSIAVVVSMLFVAITDDFSVLPTQLTIPLSIAGGLGLIVTALLPLTEFKHHRKVWRILARIIWFTLGSFLIVSGALPLVN